MWVATFLLSIVCSEEGGKTSLKSRREQSPKVTSRKTVRPIAGALPALPALVGRSQSGRPAGSLGCAPTALGSSRQSHSEKGVSVMMAARGRRLFPRSLPTPPSRPGSAALLPPPPCRAGPERTLSPAPQPTGCPRPRAPAPPASSAPVRTKQTTRPLPPSFLSPLTAWPPATSAVHAPNQGFLRGQGAPGPPRGATW